MPGAMEPRAESVRGPRSGYEARRAWVTEYFDRFEMFGHDYLQVVTVVDDPAYLTTPFVVSNHFKREADDSKWNPTPCSIDPPVGTFQPPAR